MRKKYQRKDSKILRAILENCETATRNFQPPSVRGKVKSERPPAKHSTN